MTKDSDSFRSGAVPAGTLQASSPAKPPDDPPQGRGNSAGAPERNIPSKKDFDWWNDAIDANRMTAFFEQQNEIERLTRERDVWKSKAESWDHTESRLRANWEFLRGLVLERQGHGVNNGAIPIWLALEWIDDLSKRSTHETVPQPALNDRALRTALNYAHEAVSKGGGLYCQHVAVLLEALEEYKAEISLAQAEVRRLRAALKAIADICAAPQNVPDKTIQEMALEALRRESSPSETAARHETVCPKCSYRYAPRFGYVHVCPTFAPMSDEYAPLDASGNPIRPVETGEKHAD